jgi:hypothetical protein
MQKKSFFILYWHIDRLKRRQGFEPCLRLALLVMTAGQLQNHVGSHDRTALMTPQIVFDNDKMLTTSA